MPSPSPLVIATQSVQRLVKEEAYYRQELARQTDHVKGLEADLRASGDAADGNAAFMLKQEQKAIEETRAVFAPLRARIVDAVRRLEEQIAAAEGEGEGEGESVSAADEIAKAKEAMTLGQSLDTSVDA